MALRALALIVVLAPACARATAQEAAPGPEIALTPPPELSQALAAHPYFARISYEFAAVAPYLFLIQKPAQAEPGYATRVAANHALHLDPALEAFERLVIQPLGLVERDASAQFLVAVLASAGDYANYLAAVASTAHPGVSSSYDPALGAAVVHESPTGETRTPAQRARSARHALIHVLEQTHASGVGRTAPRAWLFEGLAAFLAGLEPERKVAPQPDPTALKEFVREGGDEGLGPLAIRSLQEMFAIGEGARVAEWLRAQRVPLASAADPARLARAFDNQAGLLVFYLHEGEGGRLRPSLRGLLWKAFRGEPDAALGEGFLAEAKSSPDQDFLRWVIQAHGRAVPGVRIPVETLMSRYRPAPEASAAPAPPQPDLASLRAALALQDARPEETFALALWSVRQGRADEGRERIARLLASEFAGDFTGDLRARIEREAERLEAWIRARDSFLQHLLETQRDLEILQGDRRVRGKLARIEPGELVFQPGRSGLERLALDALDPLGLAQQMETKREGWIRAYGYVLCGDERWKKVLEDEPAEARVLREEAGDYAQRLRTGELATALSELAARPAARTPAEAERWLDELAAIPTRAAGLELAERKRPALLALAGEVAGTLFDLQTPWSQLHARIETKDDGVLVLTYAFDDPLELADFEAVPYLEGFHDVPLEGEPANAFVVEQGELRGSGRVCLRTLFGVGAPLVVRYELALDEPAAASLLNVGICDDRQEHFAWALNFHHLQVWGPKTRAEAHKQENTAFYAGRVYAMELRHDGARVTLACDGVQQQELPSQSLAEGAVFLWLHSGSRARIQRLEIEGRFDATPPHALRAAWIERQLAARFPGTRH